MPRRAAELDLDLNLKLDLDLNLGRRCKGVEPYTNPIAHHQTPTRARTPTLTQADAKAASPSAPSPSPSQPHTSVRKARSHDATAARNLRTQRRSQPPADGAPTAARPEAENVRTTDARAVPPSAAPSAEPPPTASSPAEGGAVTKSGGTSRSLAVVALQVGPHQHRSSPHLDLIASSLVKPHPVIPAGTTQPSGGAAAGAATPAHVP